MNYLRFGKLRTALVNGWGFMLNCIRLLQDFSNRNWITYLIR